MARLIVPERVLALEGCCQIPSVGCVMRIPSSFHNGIWKESFILKTHIRLVFESWVMVKETHHRARDLVHNQKQIVER